MAEKKTYPKEIFIQKCKESESLLKHLIGPEHSIEEPLKITLLKKKPVPPETFRKLIKTCRKLVKVYQALSKSPIPIYEDDLPKISVTRNVDSRYFINYEQLFDRYNGTKSQTFTVADPDHPGARKEVTKHVPRIKKHIDNASKQKNYRKNNPQ